MKAVIRELENWKEQKEKGKSPPPQHRTGGYIKVRRNDPAKHNGKGTPGKAGVKHNGQATPDNAGG